MLTQLKAEATTGAEPTQPDRDAVPSAGSGTEAYRLVGMHDELRPHVGKRVRITGETEPEQVVDVRQSTPPAATSPPAGAAHSGRTDQPAGTTGPEAQVGTTETARIEINDLQVRSVSARSEPCAAAG